MTPFNFRFHEQSNKELTLHHDVYLMRRSLDSGGFSQGISMATRSNTPAAPGALRSAPAPPAAGRVPRHDCSVPKRQRLPGVR